MTAFQVTFDANDPVLLANFWCLALDYVIQPAPPGFDTWDDWARAMEIPEEHWEDARAIVDPHGTGPRIFIQKVPEPKAAKNRMHLDVNVSGGHGVALEDRMRLVGDHVAKLVAAGATQSRTFNEPERGDYWVVMQDPEGNEFCVQ